MRNNSRGGCRVCRAGLRLPCEATAALAAAHTWQVFLEGREVARNIGIQEGRYMMPEWFKVSLKPGYNWVVVKVAPPDDVATYRHEWGAKLQVFTDGRQ